MLQQAHRQERRHDGFGRLLSWRPADIHRRRRKGWLHDYSLSGLSFLVGTPARPGLGADVEVCFFGRTGTHRLYHVVRLEPLCGRLTKVACRHDPPAAARLHPAPTTPRLAHCRPQFGLLPTPLASGRMAPSPHRPRINWTPACADCPGCR